MVSPEPRSIIEYGVPGTRVHDHRSIIEYDVPGTPEPYGVPGTLLTQDIVLRTVDAENQELLRRATESSILPESWKDYFRKRLWDPDA
jgi:hypothetical protein